ncbi:MAG: YraN family protein [Bacteroidales bacterium]|nr:YraN family protein [Bacteroidales bacterium]
MATKELGDKGERLAAEYLAAKGYTILHTNWRWQHKELDLVALQGQELVVVEVKTRQSLQWQMPYEAVSRKKQRNIVQAADAYASRLDADYDVRFDVISIVWNNGSYIVEHIEDAFTPLLL